MTIALILAGGKGERLRPLTFEIHKSMIPIYSYPLLTHITGMYHKSGVSGIDILTSPEGYQQICAKFNGNRVWLEKDPIGTGGWINTNVANTNEIMFVNNGDNLIEIDFNDFLNSHNTKSSIVTIACVRVSDMSQYGSVVINGRKITEFIEKSKNRKRKSGWVSSGYYVIDIPKLKEFMKLKGLDKQKVISIENEVFPLLAKEGYVGAHKHFGMWFDVGTIDRYSEVLHKWKKVPQPFVVE